MEELSIRVTRTQRFFANGWALWVCLGACAIGLPGVMLQTVNLKAAFASGWHVWLPLVGASLIFAIVGFLFGAIIACLILGPLYGLRARLNGGPFAPGDRVVVLSGKHRGRRGSVYAEWQEGTVRVGLGEQEKARFQDIFGQHQLLRQ